jgi:tripartite-type tricarboxylate transporter receptor subunit TctC
VTVVDGRHAHVLFNGMLPLAARNERKLRAIGHLERETRRDAPTRHRGGTGLPASRPVVPGRGRAARHPARHVVKLNAELTKVPEHADMKERFAKQGTEVRTGTPESLGSWMATEQAKWAKVGQGVGSEV